MRVKVPRIGKTVVYKRVGLPSGKYAGDDNAALVTKVYTDKKFVDMVSFSASSEMKFHKKVKYGKGKGQWRWPERTDETMVVEG